jgi:hypothetical protein
MGRPRYRRRSQCFRTLVVAGKQNPVVRSSDNQIVPFDVEYDPNDPVMNPDG